MGRALCGGRAFFCVVGVEKVFWGGYSGWQATGFTKIVISRSSSNDNDDDGWSKSNVEIEM